MAALTEAGIVAAELENVRDKVPVLFEREGPFFSSIDKKDVETVSKRDMRIPLELRPGGRFGQWNPEGGALGRGGAPEFDKATINVFHFKHAVEWTTLADWATDNKRKAVISASKRLLASGMKEFRRQIESQCMTAGDGVLGTVSGVSTGGGADTLTLNTDGYGIKLLRSDQMINVYNAALSTRRVHTGLLSSGGEAPIILYDPANKQIKVSGSTGATVATDKVVISGVTATPPTSLKGVPYHHNSAATGTWLGLDRSLVPEIRANRTQAGGALALPLARLAINKSGDRVGVEEMQKCQAWMHPCQAQAYEELGQLVTMINKTAKDEALNRYFGDNMQMAGAQVKKSFMWDKTRIDFVFSDVWGRAEMHAADYYKDSRGKTVFEIVSTTDGSPTSNNVFYLVASFDLFVDNPAVCTYIDGLTVPAGY